MVAVIGTVLNESSNINGLLSDLKVQTLKPDEIVIVDAGSTDGTEEILRSGGVKVIFDKGVNRSAGRNIAIRHTSEEVIVACDAGTRINKEFVESLVAPIKAGVADIVSGFFKPEVRNFFEKCLASVTIPVRDEIEEDRFLPSSRSVAFKKSAWERVYGYPEWLPVCEDLIFDLKLKKAGFVFKFEPKALAFWRPRSSAKSFFDQYFSYARGDGHAKLWGVRHAIRYTAYVTGALLLYFSFSISPLWLLPFAAAQIGYFSKFYYRYIGHFVIDDEDFSLIWAIPYISFLVVVGDVAKMCGYPLGIFERLTGKVTFEPY